MWKDARFLPVSLHCPLRNTLHSSDFGKGKATKEFQIDDKGKSRFELHKVNQCFAVVMPLCDPHALMTQQNRDALDRHAGL